MFFSLDQVFYRVNEKTRREKHEENNRSLFTKVDMILATLERLAPANSPSRQAMAQLMSNKERLITAVPSARLKRPPARQDTRLGTGARRRLSCSRDGHHHPAWGSLRDEEGR
jgi:hypothetical protein